MLVTSFNPPRDAQAHLLNCGWRREAGLLPMFRLPTKQGEAVLSRTGVSHNSAWQEWEFTSPCLDVPDRETLFAANLKLAGPWKFLSTPEGCVRCRGDVPREVFASDETFDLETGGTSSPLAAWAEQTTALANGESLIASPEESKPSPAHLVDWLKDQGHVASADGTTVRVTVPLSGAFREVALWWSAGHVVHLQTELGRLDDWPANSVLAAQDFLQEANRRLRLARVSQAAERIRVFGEVCFRASGSGVWLHEALEALCTGMALVVQPLAALRDPGVADAFLAETSANL